MSQKVAGLLFSERLRKSAKQAGFDRVYFLSPDLPGLADGDLPDDLRHSGESSLVLLKAGYLPDTSYFKSLRFLGQKEGQHVFGENAPVLVFTAKSPETWLRKVVLYRSSPDIFTLLKNEFTAQQSPAVEGSIYKIDSADQIPSLEKQLFNALVKDTEGFMSKHVERKISLTISRGLVDSSITPNQMTIFSVFVGLVGAVFLGVGQGACQIVGALLFLAHSILDGCDGELARIRFQQSRFGGLLDYWGDNVVHSAVFLALAFEWSKREAVAYPYVLGGLAVLGTLASASWIYWKTMREKSATEPLYVSVSTSKEKSRVTEVADFLSRRDFIYLVVVLACFKKLDWFLALSSVGAPTFFLVLLWIHFQERSGHEVIADT